MDASTPSATLGDYLSILHRRRKYLITIIPGALLIAVYLAYALPAVYRSTSTLLLEASEISENVVASTLTSYADQQFELMQRRVLNVANLESVVTEFDPYPDHPELTNRDKALQIIDDTLIERVDPITFEVLQESNAFSIHYHNSNPARAAEVAKRLGALFMDYNRKTRSEQAVAVYDFLQEQSSQVEKRILEADQKIADFKVRRGAALPEAQARNLGAADRASRDLLDSEALARAAEERLSLLTVQLSKISPTLGSTTGNTQTELATLQGQLAEARVRYTPDHPDVKRLQRQIEALNAKAASDPGGGRVVPNNPEYLSVQSQINAAQREISALQATAARARSEIYQYQAGIAAAPSAEREFSELARGRETLQLQFDDLQKRIRDADIARNLEVEQRGNRFTQIRAPSTPSTPYSPNRLGIILLGIVLGSGLAMGLVALTESADATVRGARDLQDVLKVSAIASVPIAVNVEDRRKHRVWWASYACLLLAATAFVALTVVRA